jgi:hypothetical protein
MKFHWSSIAFLTVAGILVVPQTSTVTSVPVEDEPLHKVVFKDEVVTVLHLTLAPGQSTLYHSHVHDRVAINLSTATVSQQKMNEPEGPPTATKPGDISALTLTDASYTHRIHNVSTAPYEVLDIEPAQRPLSPSPDGQTASHQVGVGDFRYVDARITHNLSNIGTPPGQIIEVELK